jgi:hypothetical protein
MRFRYVRYIASRKCVLSFWERWGRDPLASKRPHQESGGTAKETAKLLHHAVAPLPRFAPVPDVAPQVPSGTLRVRDTLPAVVLLADGCDCGDLIGQTAQGGRLRRDRAGRCAQRAHAAQPAAGRPKGARRHRRGQQAALGLRQIAAGHRGDRAADQEHRRGGGGGHRGAERGESPRVPEPTELTHTPASSEHRRSRAV